MTRQSKNTPTKKKTSSVKKASTSKKASAKKAAPLTWRFYAVAIGIFTISVTAMVVIALFTATIVERNTNQERLSQIKDIYSSLELGDAYQTEKVDIFGDKRAYGDDKSSTESSTIEYLHGDSVSNTVADLDTKIKAAGFVFIGEPYPTAKETHYHYKSADNEYIRLIVGSKPYLDAMRNSLAMGQELSEQVKAMDLNAGPARVLIKVNLDDNNG